MKIDQLNSETILQPIARGQQWFGCEKKKKKQAPWMPAMPIVFALPPSGEK